MRALQCAIKAITWEVHEDWALAVTSSSEVDRKINRKKGPDWDPFFVLAMEPVLRGGCSSTIQLRAITLFHGCQPPDIIVNQ